MDNECEGRGHAMLDVTSIKTILELRKKKVDMTDAVVKRL